MKVSPIPETPPQPMARVLLVEDDPPVQEVLERWLAECGQRVVTCRTFQQARAHLAVHTPEILITDLRLQDYNGLQLVMHLREKRPAARCLVITGHDDPVLRKEAQHMHAGYLLKPFGRVDFFDAIRLCEWRAGASA